ncbi:MAG: response regulator transcription factor [Muricoprocola sp.]
MKKIKILIVEDEEKLSITLQDFLRIKGYETIAVSDGRSALETFEAQKKEIDLILLDLMLPVIGGFSILREIRKISEVPVIIISARSAIEDQMRGFEKGADDYITKPFSLSLMNLHIEAILKRAGKLRTLLNYKEISIDMGSQKVYWKDELIETTRKEFELLVYFIEHNDIALERSTILDAVWGYDYVGDIRTVDTVVKQLRKKMPAECNYIHSIYGVGYIFGGDRS